MANWNILNKEFDAVLNSISDADFEDWYSNIEAQKEIGKLQMLLEAKLQSERISFKKQSGKVIVKETVKSNPIVDYSKINVAQDYSCDEQQFALVA